MSLASGSEPVAARGTRPAGNGRSTRSRGSRHILLASLLSVPLVGATLVVRYLFGIAVGDRPMVILFVPPILVCAYLGGLGPGLVTSALSAAVVKWFLFPPRGSFAFSRPADAVQWLVFVACGVLVSLLSEALHRRRNEEERWRSLHASTLASLDEGIVSVDASGGVTDLNAEAERLCGWGREEARGRPVDEVLPLAGGPRGTPVLTARDGLRREVDLRRVPIGGKGRAVAGTLTVFRDATARLEAEEAQRRRNELQERLEKVTASVPGVVCSFRRAPDGAVSMPYASAALTEVTGLSPADVAADAAPLLALFHPDDLVRLQETLDGSARTMSRWHGELRVLVPGRGEAWIEGRSVPVREADGSVLWHGFVHDVTGRKRAEGRLRASEQRFARLFHESPVPITLTRAADGCVLDVNAAFSELTGYPREEVVGRSSDALGILGDSESRAAAYAAIRDRGEVHEAEMSLRTRSGEERRVLIDAHVIELDGVPSILAVTRDVTALRSAEQKLHEREEIFAAIAEQAADSLVVVDLPTGAFVEFNTAAHRNLGYTREEFARMRIADVDAGIPPEELPDHIVGTARGRERFETRQRHRDGSLRDVLVSATPVQIRGRNYLSSIWTDITDRKLMEAEVQRLNADLERRVEERTAQLAAANKELDSFAYAVSHDLRAPLRGLGGFSQLLVEDFGDRLGDEALGYVARIREATRTMEELVDGLLALSRSTRGELRREQVDLSAVAGKVLAELRRAEPLRTVSCSVEPGLSATGDPRMVEAALRNLLGNAWKYTSQTEGASIRLYAEAEDDRPVFCVADNGAGFDMAHTSGLFQPFQRLHRKDEFPGIGIGLATVQRIVARHGGRIWAEGAPGRGATFRFTLSPGEAPAAPAPCAA